MLRSRLLLVAVTGALIAGCASSPGDDLPPFGETFREVMSNQVYRSGDEVPTLNGEKAGGVMEAYRKQGAAPSPMASESPGT